MKDTITFILVSLLIFNIINGDDFRGGLHPNLVNPLMASSIIIPKSTNLNPGNSTTLETKLQDFLVLAFKPYNLEQGIFYVLARIISMNIPSHIELTAKVETSSNLRFLEEKTEDFDCPLETNQGISGKYIFKCQGKDGNYSSISIDLDSMKINGNKAYSIPAAALTKDIDKNFNSDVANLLFDKEIIAMQECKFTDNENKVIEGTMESPINSPDGPYLLLTKSGKSKKIDCTYKDLNKPENKYSITLNTESKLNENLHEQIGKINDQQTVILDFADGLGDTDPTTYNKKSSSGLSTGGIVAIVIPCIAVLLAAAGLAFIMGNRNTKPPMQNIENNTIGVNSSAIINNK